MKKLILLLITSSFLMSSYCQTAEEYFEKGQMKDSIEDYKGAIADYTKAIELNPKYVDAYNFSLINS